MPNGVPKIVHQTWKREDIPEHWKPGQQAWKKQHPDWLYCFWTDQDLHDQVLSHQPSFWPTWTSFQQHIQRVDAIRQMILEDIGGVYCDLDLMPNQNLEPFLAHVESDVILVKSANEPCQTNMFMAARSPLHRQDHSDSVWKRMIRHMKTSVMEPKWYSLISKHFQVMTTTGPLALTQVVDQQTSAVAVLPKARFNAFGILEAGRLDQQELQKQPVLQVLEGSSWHAWDSVTINWLLRYKWWLVAILGSLLGIMTILSIVAQVDQTSMKEKLKKLLVRIQERKRDKWESTSSGHELKNS